MNIDHAMATIDALVEAGLRRAVICPGSRSTPFALVAQAHPDVQVTIGIDERSAGFFALGMAKASKSPTAIITTSGTAVANLLPAIVEAHQSNTPLIILSADRPPHQRGTGANQTIDQVGMFGGFVRASFDAALPPESAADSATQAWQSSTRWPPGPVHFNQPFAKPLEPTETEAAQLDALGRRAPRPGAAPSTPTRRTLEHNLPGLAQGNGLVILGPQCDTAAWIVLAQAGHVPILADALSGLRDAGPAVAGSYDGYIDAEPVMDAMRPDWIVQDGMAPTSAALNRFLAQHKDVPRYRIDASGRGWNDVPGRVTMLAAGAEAVAAAITAIASPRWLADWRALDQAARQLLDEAATSLEAAWIAPVLAHGAPLFVGNSMPIRDVDRFAHGLGVELYANRGASGIDGTIATAAGIAAIHGHTVAVIGDVAFQHDIGSLAWLPSGLKLIVLDNGGGRIFQHLPIASQTPHFEALFLTKPQVDAVAAARAFGLRATSAELSELGQALHSGDQVIVVRTDGEHHATERQRLHARVQTAIAAHMSCAQAS